MPPSDSSIESKYRYANRLLAALTLQAGGELRIPMKFIRTIEGEDKRQALMEDSNLETEEIVLRLFTKNAALYPIESDKWPASSTASPPPQPARPESSQQVREPLTVEKLQKLQRAIHQRLQKAALQKEQTLRERQQEDLSSILEPSSRD